jgi:hypothetical protein
MHFVVRYFFRFVAADDPIDLLNVAFQQTSNAPADRKNKEG